MLVTNQNDPLPSSSKSLAQSLTESVSGKEPSQVDCDLETHQNQEEREASTDGSSVIEMEPPMMGTSPRRDSNQFTDSLSAIRQQLNRSNVPEFLVHLPTLLVEYYFNYVCQIFSSFDGTLNPFRSTVGRLWDGSAPIYYAIQSMAAAYLANHFPRMSPVGVQMQRETYRCLYQSQQGSGYPSENLDKTLLTVLLVGQTTAWHDPKDLGLVHLKTAKRLNRRRLEQQGGSADIRARRQNEFFEQCILYWDMLAGFVEDDVDELGFGGVMAGEVASESPGNGQSPSTEDNKIRVFPHPWTGVAPKVQKLFAQVGRLIRSYRKILAQDAESLGFLALDLGFDVEFPEDSSAMTAATAKAQALEEELLSFQPPSESNLVDAGDENTPVQQYIYLADAYRCAALLQIYRIFPSILYKRVPVSDNSFPSLSTGPGFLSDFLPIPISQPPDDFLVSLAMHTISLLEKLPPNSGTRCLQPIVLIVAASELRFPTSMSFDPLSPYPLPQSTSIFNSLTSREVDIASARQFVTARLQEFQSSLPAKPIMKAELLVKQTWERADTGFDVFWMDVMEEMGLRSIYG